MPDAKRRPKHFAEDAYVDDEVDAQEYGSLHGKYVAETNYGAEDAASAQKSDEALPQQLSNSYLSQSFDAHPRATLEEKEKKPHWVSWIILIILAMLTYRLVSCMIQVGEFNAMYNDALPENQSTEQETEYTSGASALSFNETSALQETEPEPDGLVFSATGSGSIIKDGVTFRLDPATYEFAESAPFSMSMYIEAGQDVDESVFPLLVYTLDSHMKLTSPGIDQIDVFAESASGNPNFAVEGAKEEEQSVRINHMSAGDVIHVVVSTDVPATPYQRVSQDGYPTLVIIDIDRMEEDGSYSLFASVQYVQARYVESPFVAE